MFELECLGTGSKGNCYIVKADGSCFLLDAGIQKKIIDKHINFNDVNLIFISHEHKDHAGALKDLKYCGKPIITGFSNKEFMVALRTSKFIAIQFPILHGECNNNALILQTKNELILYATDFNICEYDLSKFKFTRIIVECNYVEEQVQEALDNHSIDYVKVKRQINTHMGLQGLQVFLDKLSLEKCKEIYLIHNSSDYGNTILEGATIFGKYKIKTGVCQSHGGIEYYGTR